MKSKGFFKKSGSQLSIACRLLPVYLFLITSSLFAGPFDFIISGRPFDMVFSEDPILEDIRFISSETGRTFLSYTPPFSLDEIYMYISGIDPGTLSPSANDAYIRIVERLEPKAALSYKSKYFSVMFDPFLTIEGRANINSDYEWRHLYTPLSSLLNTPINITISDTFQLYMDFSLNMERKTQGIDLFETNIPIKSSRFDVYTPQRAFGAAGGSWWNFIIGRDNYYWGSAHSGSLTFNANSSFLDFARLTLFADVFKYTFIINQLPLWINENHKHNYFDPPNPDGWPDGNNDYLVHTTNRYFYLHRIDAKFFNRVSIGVMEGTLIGNDSIAVRYLNPFHIFHSLFGWYDYDTWKPVSSRYGEGAGSMVGSFFSVEINWNIVKSLSFYAQFVMNEFALPGEGGGGINPPNAMGYLAGFQFSRSLKTWNTVFYLEAIYTDPYLFILSSPFSSFIYDEDGVSSQTHYLGYPRDTFSLALGAKTNNNKNLLLQGSFSWIAKGQKDTAGNRQTHIYWDWEQTQEAFDLKSPSGIINHFFKLSLSAKWKMFPFLTIGGSLTGIVSLNNNHVKGVNQTGGQVALSVSYHPSFGKKRNP